MKNNMVKKLLTLALAGAMTLSLAACGSKSDDSSNDAQQGGDESSKTYKVAIIKQLDHASLDEIANAVAAELESLGVPCAGLMPVGLDTAIIPAVPGSKAEIRRALKIDEQARVLAFVGRLDAYKQPLDLVPLLQAAPAMAMGVTEMRLLTMGMPNSRSMSSPVLTSPSA